MKPELKIVRSETVGEITYLVAELTRSGMPVYASIRAMGAQLEVLSTHLDEAHAVTAMIRAVNESHFHIGDTGREIYK